MGLVGFWAATSVRAGLVQYSQAFNNTSRAIGSQNETDPAYDNYMIAYDNFTLPSSTSIESLSWVYFDSADPSGTIAAGNITGWTINFYRDSLNEPGSLISSTSISSNANETFLGQFNHPGNLA